jgi:hypothetical protein
MGLLGNSDIGSPIQKHPVDMANDLLWITGELETLGNPHNYINQDGLNFLQVETPHVVPWVFTGLPASHPPLIVTARDHIQFLTLSGEEAMEQFRPPMNLHPLIIHLPLAVIRGRVPFLSEAKVNNFLDFWKGEFFPVIDAKLHMMAEGPASLPTEAPVVYVNRHKLQSYVEG